MEKDLNGKGRQGCCKCSFKSLRGHVKGQGLCPYHWAELVWGKDHASKQYPRHPEADK